MKVIILALALLFSPSIAAAQDAAPRISRDIVPSLRPNDTLKINRSLPWVSVYKAPSVYAAWWAEIAACEHLILPTELLSSVRFVQVNARTFRTGPMLLEALYGYTQSDRNTIVIAQSKVFDKSVVMHEMAHQLNVWNAVDEGPDYHPYDTFEVCGLHVSYP